MNLELITSGIVNIAPPVNAGIVNGAQRMMVAITGGRFTGRIEAAVLPGGADWPCIRPDGSLTIDAVYAIRTDAGVVIQVHNRASVKRLATNEPIWTVPGFIAPDGDFDWLNHGSFAGLVRQGPGEGEVTIQFYRAVPGE